MRLKTQLMTVLGASFMLSTGVMADTTLVYGDEKGQETTRVLLTSDIFKVTQADADGEIIFNGDKNEFIVVNHDEKSYMLLDEKKIASVVDMSTKLESMLEKQMAAVPEAQREMMRDLLESKIKSQMPKTQEPSFRENGATKEYNGYSCKVVLKYIEENKSTGDYCVTEYDKLDVAPAEYEVIVKFMKIGEKMASQFGEYNSMNFLDIGPVLPVYFNDQHQIGILMDINNDKIDAASLSVPKGYKQQELPGKIF